MALPVTFASLAGGSGVTQPLALFDQNFAAVGALVTFPCFAAGQNSIVLTPIANTPTVASYVPGVAQLRVAWVQAQTTTAAATANFGSLGSRNVYKGNGLVATGAGDLVAGGLYEAQFNPALNGGAGGWVLINPPIPTAATAFPWGAFKRLRGANTAGSESISFNWIVDSIVVSDGISNFAGLLNVNVAPQTGFVGANGLDAGGVAASTWYAGYVIYNPTTQTAAGLFSTSFTSPTLPAGYTMYARVGAVRTDGSSNLLRLIQYGRQVQYQTNQPVMTNSFGAPWTAVTTGNFVPPQASRIRVIMQASLNGSLGASATVMVAPNNNYGTTITAVPPPPLGFGFAAGSNQNNSFWQDNQVGDFVLESSNIFTGFTSNAGGGVVGVQAVLAALGWEDNL